MNTIQILEGLGGWDSTFKATVDGVPVNVQETRPQFGVISAEEAKVIAIGAKALFALGVIAGIGGTILVQRALRK